jgi:hypothetical protein
MADTHWPERQSEHSSKLYKIQNGKQSQTLGEAEGGGGGYPWPFFGNHTKCSMRLSRRGLSFFLFKMTSRMLRSNGVKSDIYVTQSGTTLKIHNGIPGTPKLKKVVYKCQ